MIPYPIPGSRQRLVFGAPALAEFARWRQARPWNREAGGQLFARDHGDAFHVQVTGPRLADRRGRYSFIPDRRAERAEIARMHSVGLHFIGDWHTHPEDVPSPSPRDVRSVADLFTRSEHRLNAMVLVIVGRLPAPCGLYVGLHDGSRLVRLVHGGSSEASAGQTCPDRTACHIAADPPRFLRWRAR